MASSLAEISFSRLNLKCPDFFDRIASRTSFVTLPSTTPPPTVPKIRPFLLNKAELPGFCGAEPFVPETVASAILEISN